MSTLIAIALLLLPFSYYLLKAQYFWDLELWDIFEDWKSLKILGVVILVGYVVLITILGHAGIAGYENGYEASLGDDWLLYYFLPGYFLSMLILPRSVANHWLGSSRFSEELVMVYGLLAVAGLSAYLVYDWF